MYGATKASAPNKYCGGLVLKALNLLESFRAADEEFVEWFTKELGL